MTAASKYDLSMLSMSHLWNTKDAHFKITLTKHLDYLNLLSLL